jgi:hypothetical protein
LSSTTLIWLNLHSNPGAPRLESGA